MDHASPAVLLDRWVSKVVPASASAWLAGRVAALAGASAPRDLFIAFSQAGRHAGHAPLALAPAPCAEADAARAGWRPATWTTSDAARARLLLAVPAADPGAFVALIDRLAAAADLGESIALYRALPLLPHGAHLAARAAEGVRSNIQAVFAAVALDNPFPAEQLDDGTWNQLVVKALFTDSPLHRIAGLDRRANPRLTRMLCDLAHERWAAGRAVAPALWRVVARCPDAGALADLERVLTTGSPRERDAVRLALTACPAPRARELLAAHGAPPPGLDWDALS